MSKNLFFLKTWVSIYELFDIYNMMKVNGIIFLGILIMVLFFTIKDKVNNPSFNSGLTTIMIDDEIKPIFEEWLMDCDSNGVKPNLNTISHIVFVDTLQKNYAGLYVYNEGIILQEFLRNHPGLKIVVYHELGHACFNLPHDTLNVGVMSPLFNSVLSEIYLKRWDHYKKQYFDYCRDMGDN